ncbi:MAG: hypothetical protein HOV80_33985 [Polyangiaceae bacterium]|nr:hypothetical protein [Polyangiaceae bacterium]
MRRPLVLALAALAALVSMSTTRVASAQDVLVPGPGTLPPSELRTNISVSRPYWSAGESRPFLAAIFETGGISLRTELDAGWGRPHYSWIGGELSSSMSLRGLSAFTGVRGVLPFGSVRFGGRYVASIQQRFIDDFPKISRPMLEVDEGPRSTYAALDGEVQFEIPLPVGKIGGVASAHGLFGVPDEFFVFEDALRMIAAGPFIGRGRLQYLAGIGDPPTFRVGGIVEVMGDPQREAVWFRTGPAVAVSLTHHLEAVGVAALTLLSPDEIGLAGADLGQIGLRYRWATGDLWPEFP